MTLAGINGINALLSSADPCDQQDNADAMIDFAKSPGVTNTDALIANAIAYRQHPRNALAILGTTPSSPYCTKPPRNQELVGVINAQLIGVNPGIFGNIQFGLFAFGASKLAMHCTSHSSLLIIVHLQMVLARSVKHLMFRLAAVLKYRTRTLGVRSPG